MTFRDDLGHGDPIPRGHISLAEAFSTLCEWRGLSPTEPLKRSPDRDAWVEKWDQAAEDLLNALVEGQLVAHICNPTTGREYRITRSEWKGVIRQEVGEREGPFVLRRISEHVNPTLNNHRDRTPYINESAFRAVFNQDCLNRLKSEHPGAGAENTGLIPESKERLDNSTQPYFIRPPAHRPRDKRDAVIEVLRQFSPDWFSGKREALLREVKSRLGRDDVSMDTLTRALEDAGLTAKVRKTF